MQEREHALENSFFDYLNTINYPCKDYHKLYDSYDIEIDGKLYDVKVSDSAKLSLFRNSAHYDWNYHCPVVEHPEIPYLYICKLYKEWRAYIIDRKSIMNTIEAIARKQSVLPLSLYTGDGNININIDISTLLTYENCVSVGGNKETFFKFPLDLRNFNK